MKPWSSPGRRSGGDWGRAPSAEGSRQGRDLQTVLYQPKAEGIAGTYILYHISRKHLRALSEINIYSETVKFSFFDFCFGFAETGFCCKPSASLFGALPQAPPERRPGLDQGSALDPRTRFRKEIFGEISERGLCPPTPRQPPLKKGAGHPKSIP